MSIDSYLLYLPPLRNIQLIAYINCLLNSIYHNYLGRMSCEHPPAKDQDRSLYLTLRGTMPHLKTMRLVEKGDSRDKIVVKSYISTNISTLVKNQTQLPLKYRRIK